MEGEFLPRKVFLPELPSSFTLQKKLQDMPGKRMKTGEKVNKGPRQGMNKIGSAICINPWTHIIERTAAL